MASCIPDGCGCDILSLDNPDMPDVGGDGDAVREAERQTAKGAIDRQFELACRVFAVQKDIGDHWQAYQGRWQESTFATRRDRPRDIDHDVKTETILRRYSETANKKFKAAELGYKRERTRYGVTIGSRTNTVNDVNMTAPTSMTHGVHHLIRAGLSRYYTNDDHNYESLIAAYHASRQEPDAIFQLLAHAQSTYSSVASSVINQQQRKSSGGGIGSLLGGIAGSFLPIPGGSALGAAVGGAILG